MPYHLTINRLLRKSQNIPFTTSEKFFDNEHDVINWIIDNQLSRRNITDDLRAYLIGKKYKEEKKAIGANRASIKEQVKQINKHVIPHNEEVKDYKSTSAKIAEQSKVSHATVAPLKTAQKIAEQSKVHFNTSEKFFDNEHDVINWIIDNQLSRRNITDDQRAYLLGKRYKEEKKAVGFERLKQLTPSDTTRQRKRNN
jgi:cell fate (sporulation/competence/biofilm development) regulator YmcA (YheA/YmcA/DUF963 family)